MKIEDLKKVLFLINFFDGIGLAFAYPWYIFHNMKMGEKDIIKKWSDYDKKEGLIQLYLHTVFCETKCHYCNCISYVDNDKNTHLKYKKYILNEIVKYGKIINIPLTTLYFGGGTFSLWGLDDMREILTAVKNNFEIAKDANWMIELHPESTSNEKLKLLKEFGVTDIMLGIQSFSENVNLKNNRPYSEKHIYKAIDMVIKSGFRKICFDMMYNLPYETDEDVEENMKRLVEIGKNINKKIKINLELNKWNISYNVPFHKILFSKEYDNFTDFSLDFTKSVENKVKIVNHYTEKYLNDLFEKNREGIDSRKKNNTAILGIGYGAISYIPGEIMYGMPVNYKKIKTFYDDEIMYDSFFLNDSDKNIFYFLNNIRSGISLDLFNNVLSKKSKAFGLVNHFKKHFKHNNSSVILKVKSDYELHLIGLSFYKESELLIVYKKLLKKWIKLGYGTTDLNENINLYLDMYYKKGTF